YQLEITNALEDSDNILVDSGTGSGKTLCMIIPNLMHPNTTSIMISPLKRLEILQVTEFQKWGINAISINEDTPTIPELWNVSYCPVCSHLLLKPCNKYMMAILSISDRFTMPRFARLLTSVQFARKIARVHINEIHFLYLAWFPHYGLPAFRRPGVNELCL
ncbi:hypothetical protein K438DRAFT_1583316, partial [Mycena galopus ATCC 62051]